MEITNAKSANIDRRLVLVKALAVVEAYLEHHKDFLGKIEVVLSEEPFNVKLINPATGRASTSVCIVGRADKLIKLNGEFFVVDHKCTVKIPERELLSFNSQLDTYVIAYRDMKYSVRGVIWDYISRPGHRRGMVPKCDAEGTPIVVDTFGNRVMTQTKTWRKTEDAKAGYKFSGVEPESDESLYARIKAEIGKDPGDWFQQFPIDRSEDDIASTRADIWAYHKMLLECHGTGCFPRNTNGCETRFGKCAFIPLCAMDNPFTRAAYQKRETRESLGLDNDLFATETRNESHSSMTDFKDCPRLYYWKQVERIESATTSEAQSVGLTIHKALDMIYTKQDAVEWLKSQLSEASMQSL